MAEIRRLRPRASRLSLLGCRTQSRTPRTSKCWPDWASRETSWSCSATASTCSASVRGQTMQDRRRARQELGVTGDALVVGTVGRLVWQKGFRELFLAAQRLRETSPDVVFVVVGGSDPEKADAISPEALATAAGRGRIVFAGSRDDMERVYPGFDLFVLPSYREGFPRSAMEAAASGLPVIATDIRGCRQVVSHGESGLLVPLRDPDALTAAIRALAADPVLRQRMGDAGRRKADGRIRRSSCRRQDDGRLRTCARPRHCLNETTNGQVRDVALVAVEEQRFCLLRKALAQPRIIQQPHGGCSELVGIIG